MTAPGRQWVEQELPVGDVRTHKSFQMRVTGLNQSHVAKLGRVLATEGALPAVEVARVGTYLYLVDGFHRLEVHRRAGIGTIRAKVAKMSLEDARAHALLANTRRGLSLSRADKQNIFDTFIRRGGHLDADGEPKSAQRIMAETNYVYSRETVRTKMKALGLAIPDDIEFPDGRKPYRAGEPTEGEMGDELAEDAAGCLTRFGELFFSLDGDDQRQLLGTARALVESLERGERPEQGEAAVEEEVYPDLGI